jgi:hypothetical protein
MCIEYSLSTFDLLLHEHFVKQMAVFIEKPPVTSLNCYETMKKDIDVEPNLGHLETAFNH